MTTTLESGRLVTSERIRADGEAMVRAGFRLVYERPLAELGGSYMLAQWMRWTYAPLHDDDSGSTACDDWRMA